MRTVVFLGAIIISDAIVVASGKAAGSYFEGNTTSVGIVVAVFIASIVMDILEFMKGAD